MNCEITTAHTLCGVLVHVKVKDVSEVISRRDGKVTEGATARSKFTQSYRTLGIDASTDSYAASTLTSSFANHPKYTEVDIASYTTLHREGPTLTATSAVSHQAKSGTVRGRLLAAIDAMIDAQALFAERYEFVPDAAEGSQSIVQYARRCVTGSQHAWLRLDTAARMRYVQEQAYRQLDTL